MAKGRHLSGFWREEVFSCTDILSGSAAEDGEAHLRLFENVCSEPSGVARMNLGEISTQGGSCNAAPPIVCPSKGTDYL